MPGLNEDQVRHAEAITYGIVNAKYDVLTVKIDALRKELMEAVTSRHCPAHDGMVMAVDRLNVSAEGFAKRRAAMPTWVSVIIAACVAIGTIVWTWTQIAMAHGTP